MARDDELRVESLAEARVHLESLHVRLTEVERRLRLQEKVIDTLWTPPWKKAWFVVQGWPLYRVVEHPRRRFWHRWVRP